MTRRRYRYDTEAKAMVEVGSDWTDTPRSTGDLHKFQHDNMRATDGTDISSRTKRREYMKANGLTDMSDYRDEWAKAAKDRADYLSGQKVDPRIRESIGRAEYERSKKR